MTMDKLDNDERVVDPDSKHCKGDDGVHDDDNLDNEKSVVDPDAEHEKRDNGMHDDNRDNDIHVINS